MCAGNGPNYLKSISNELKFVYYYFVKIIFRELKSWEKYEFGFIKFNV